MKSAAAVICAVAVELFDRANRSLPKLKDGEVVTNEGLKDGIYFRESTHRGKKLRAEYDFRQKENRQ